MKTFVVEEVLRNYTGGLIVVKAQNIEHAKDLLIEKFNNNPAYALDVYGDVTIGIRELQNDEIVYVYGGD